MARFVFEDKTGMRFGRLTAIEYEGKGAWSCRCDCGNVVTVKSSELNSGRTKSCGCYIRDIHSKPKHDLVGKRFGRLTVLEYAGNERWKCVCDCGGTALVRTNNLTLGNARSCGCYQKDVASRVSRKHGDSSTPLYKVWCSMRQRCCNPNSKAYRDYGGRGISVCDEWAGFEPFKEWAMSAGYRQGLTIDRIDNDGNYCPENCRWVGMSVQNANKRPYEKPKLFKPVEMCDEDGNTVMTFPSIKAASEYLGGNTVSNRANISKVARGEREHAFGWRWRYAFCKHL